MADAFITLDITNLRLRYLVTEVRFDIQVCVSLSNGNTPEIQNEQNDQDLVRDPDQDQIVQNVVLVYLFVYDLAKSVRHAQY